MKKFFYVLLSVVLFAGFTSCNKSSEEENKQEGKEENKAAVDPMDEAINNAIAIFENFKGASDAYDKANESASEIMTKAFEKVYGFDPNSYDLTEEQNKQLEEFMELYKDKLEKLENAQMDAYMNIGSSQATDDEEFAMDDDEFASEEEFAFNEYDYDFDDEYTNEAVAKKAKEYATKLEKAMENGDESKYEKIEAEAEAWFESLSDKDKSVAASAIY